MTIFNKKLHKEEELALMKNSKLSEIERTGRRGKTAVTGKYKMRTQESGEIAMERAC